MIDWHLGETIFLHVNYADLEECMVLSHSLKGNHKKKLTHKGKFFVCISILQNIFIEHSIYILEILYIYICFNFLHLNTNLNF